MRAPSSTIWGGPQSCHEIIPSAVFYVTTASHGGYVVAADWAALNLSEAACEVGCDGTIGPVLYFEEDCDWAVLETDNLAVCAAAEVLYGDNRSLPERYRAARECCERWNPGYLAARPRELFVAAP